VLHTGLVKRIAAVVTLAMMLGGCSSGPIRTYTKEEITSMLDADREWQKSSLLEEYPDATLPEVEVEHYVTGDEWADVMAQCLRDAGWNVGTTSDEGLSTDVPADQSEAFRIDYYVCQVRYPFDPRRSLPLNDRQRVYLYEYDTHVLKPCLEAFGYIPVKKAPTLEAYLQSGGEWNPYTDLTSSAPWRDMARRCPPEPPGLYGE
jgi:hypothetical protein